MVTIPLEALARPMPSNVLMITVSSAGILFGQQRCFVDVKGIEMAHGLPAEELLQQMLLGRKGIRVVAMGRKGKGGCKAFLTNTASTA